MNWKNKRPVSIKTNKVKLEALTPITRKVCRSKWAALIKKVYETDPLLCPHCGAEMKFIAFIERKDQADVIEKILKHCNLWNEPKRSLPPGIVPYGDDDFILVPEYAFYDETLFQRVLMEFPANF
jgi:hypothetical protein